MEICRCGGPSCVGGEKGALLGGLAREVILRLEKLLLLRFPQARGVIAGLLGGMEE